MHVLILSCNIGEGHNSCASALKEHFEENGYSCDTVDALSFVSNTFSRFLSRGHTFIYRHMPKIFAKGYRFAENHRGIYRKGSLLYRCFCRNLHELASFIDKNGYDTIICPHPISAALVASTADFCKTKFISALVATDYTASPVTDITNADAYFIPDSSLKGSFMLYGIPEEKIVNSGIPVRKMFYDTLSADIARHQEGIKTNSTHLLIMCGSMGCGRIDKILSHISKKLRENEEVTIVCGTNKRMEKKLLRRYRGRCNIHIKGYVTNISRLMDSADLYLTKPGGISVSEARAKRLPMIYINAVAGCEEYNRAFFERCGVAVSENTPRNVAERCIKLMRNREELDRMRQNFAILDNINPCELICRHLENEFSSDKRF